MMEAADAPETSVHIYQNALRYMYHTQKHLQVTLLSNLDTTFGAFYALTIALYCI